MIANKVGTVLAMRYWWANQKQTYKHEFHGGYLWSPKKKTNGAVNPFYEFMRNVAPGDIIFSFAFARICAIGIAQSNAYESPKPPEFGNAGPNWDAIGWRIDVRFIELDNQIRPADHMDKIGPVLQSKYAPLQPSGHGNQSVYLTFVPPLLADVLVTLIGEQAWQVTKMFDRVARQDSKEIDLAAPASGLVEWEEHLIEELSQDASLSSTEKHALVLARRGQGLFKKNVMAIERCCRVTKVDQIEHLRASHIKPWRDCKDRSERLAATNGLLLTPSIDHLFDRGFISFEDNGVLLVSPAAHDESLQRMGVETSERINVGTFSQEQRKFLDFHRQEVFLSANIRL
jgi:putative restriction endonuclease